MGTDTTGRPGREESVQTRVKGPERSEERGLGRDIVIRRLISSRRSSYRDGKRTV